eukprot:TRINITY_DN90627_c0_g1_i1.p1 TRINITY_DN90627_c0_g1~~TRINITY_DN90627_c0_g1_i1.p1  ORF type:complete len:589 (-),score=88.63 TRINITY_DN90627_c0_g1_i1:32-1750(-)
MACCWTIHASCRTLAARGTDCHGSFFSTSQAHAGSARAQEVPVRSVANSKLLDASRLRRFSAAATTAAGEAAAAALLVGATATTLSRRFLRRHKRSRRCWRARHVPGQHTRRSRGRCTDEPSEKIVVGHDGSEEARRWLEAVEAAKLFGRNAHVLSPPGVPSEVPAALATQEDIEALGRVWAVLPAASSSSISSQPDQVRVLKRLERASWAVEPPCIGSGHEWDTWEYARALMGESWRDMYDWEYLRYLEPPDPQRTQSIAESMLEVDAARIRSQPSAGSATECRWWQHAEGARALTAMLDRQGFCVIDDFLSADLAGTVARIARGAWEEGHMKAGQLAKGGHGGVRGDAVLWVNTADPAELAAFAAAEQHGTGQPQAGQSSAAVEELAGLLDAVDSLVGNVLFEKKPTSKLRSVLTRSHPMFTCYAAASEATSSSDQRGYLRHLDNEKGFASQRDNGRVLTTILYLNDSDKEWTAEDAGDLRLFERYPPLRIRDEILPKMNRLVAFYSAEVPHEVIAPRRDRFACTFWYLNNTAGPTSVPFELAPALQARELGYGSTPVASLGSSATAFLD